MLALTASPSLQPTLVLGMGPRQLAASRSGRETEPFALQEKVFS